MIAIDTNVLLRLFTEPADDPLQSRAARDLVRGEAPVFVNPIVLAELAWTLRSTYRLDRAAVHACLASIASAPEFTLMFPEATSRAIDLYEAGPADFSDYMIGEIDTEIGCSTTVTFDKQAARDGNFTRLQS